MKKFLLVAGLLVGVMASACKDEPLIVDSLGATPSIKPPAGSVVASAVAPGDTLKYKLNLTSFGNRATGAQFTVTASGAGWLVRPIRQATTTLSTDFILVNTTDWMTSTFKLYAWGTRGTQISKDSTLIATWTVQREVGPPPGGSIDSSATQALRQYLNPENLAVISPVQVHSEPAPTCAGEWAGARNRSLRILPVVPTDSICRQIFRTMRINRDALFADSVAAAAPDTSIYKGPPLPWFDGALLPVVDAVPELVSFVVLPPTVELKPGESTQLCAQWTYGDGTALDTCSWVRRRAV